jgi:hypothetical protein
MFKALSISFILVAVSATGAFAGQCKDDIGKIDAAILVTKIDADHKQEVSDLREQAVQLCGAGNEDAAVDVTAQAKTILDIE